jgi:hypothetical protein
VEQAAAKLRGEGAERPHDLGDLGRYWLLNFLMRLSLVSVRRETISLRQKRRKNGERPQRVAKFTYSPALCNIKYKTIVLLSTRRQIANAE